MAIKKDAGKADIGPKKQVKATFAECTAENPLKCKYHGIGALQKLVGETLYKAGLGKVANICTKDGKGYKIQIPQEVNIPENAYSALSDALFDKGFSLGFKDIENNMTVFTAVRTDGGDFVTPEGEAELEDADTISSSDAPDKKQGEADDVDNLEGSHTNEPTDEDWAEVAKAFGYNDTPTEKQMEEMKGIIVDGKLDGSPLMPSTIDHADDFIFANLPKDNPVHKIWEDTKKKLLGDANSEEQKQDQQEESIDDSELDSDLLDNFDDLDEVMAEATEDLEKELMGNSDFDDIFSGDGDEIEGDSNKGEPPISDDDIKALVALMGVKQEHFEAHDDLMDSYHSIIEKGANLNGGKLTDGQKQWWNSLISEVKKSGFDNPAAKQMLKTFGQDGDSAAPFTDEDLKNWLQGIGWDHIVKDKGMFEDAKSIILNKKMSYGADLDQSTIDAYLAAAKTLGDADPVSAYIMKTFEGQGGAQPESSKPKELTKDDIIETFSPTFSGNLPKDNHFIRFYGEVLKYGYNPNGTELNDDQIEWFKKASDNAHAKGISNYALELLDKMLNAKGIATKKSTTSASSNPSSDITEADCVALLEAAGQNPDYYADDAPKAWLNLIKTGNNLNGVPISGDILGKWKEIADKAEKSGESLAALPVLKSTLAKLGANNPPTMDDLVADMTSVVDKMHQTGLTLTWDAKKGNALGKAFEDAVNSGNIATAQEALKNFKDYIQKLENGDEGTEVDGDSITPDEIGDFFKKCGIKKPSLLSAANLAATKQAIETGKWQGKPLTKGNKKWYQALADKVPGHKVAKAINAMLSGGASPTSTGAKPKKFTLKAIKDFVGTYKGTKPIPNVPLAVKQIKEIVEKGSLDGTPISQIKGDWTPFIDVIKGCADGPIKDAALAALGASSSSYGSSSSTSGGGSAKDAILSALSSSKGVPTFSTNAISKQMLKPLEHDESKFPVGVTKEMLDKALMDSSAKALGGASGDHATLIYIDGKKYVCKKGSGTHAEHIHNEVLADQAYRAGGIRAPDCKEYVFGGHTYKLAEFIEGKSLSSYMASATSAQQETLRKDLLAGFPMDVLLSNWDVIGTSRDNIIVDSEGHGWRIDNGGAFDMAAMSNKKTMAWAVENYINIPKKYNEPPLAAFEDWDKEGGWEHRQWIDDFRTMRIDEKNKGLFDQYSTADIFLSAANIDFANAVAGLPQGLKDALAKPLFEMRAMSHQAWCAKEAGYSTARSMTWKDANGNIQVTQVDTMSAALDAIYEAHKDGCREWLQKKTEWGNLGWLSSSGKGSGYQKKVFNEQPPPEPLPPPMGTDLTSPILTAIISIHHHIKQGDYSPNQTSIKKALELKPILEMLASENVDKSKGLLEAVEKIEAAAKDGYKKQLTFNTPDGLFDSKGLSLSFDSVHKAIFEKHNAQKHAEWQKKMDAYLDKKKKWDEEEEKKAKAAGAAPENSFGDYEDKLIEANIDTNGVARGGGKPKCNHESKAAQKSTSFCTESCKKKVRQYAMMGIPLDAMYFANDDKVFYNGNTDNGGSHVSGCHTDEKDFFAAVDFYRQNPDIFKVDMESYARHKGMMALVHMNIENDAINPDDGTVFVMRSEHVEAFGKNGVGHPTGASKIIDRYPIDSSTSAQINGVGTLGDLHLGWKLPIWRVSDNFMIGTHGVNSGNDGEMEICINPIQIPYPPMYFSSSDVCNGWEHCMQLYLSQPQIKGAAET